MSLNVSARMMLGALLSMVVFPAMAASPPLNTMISGLEDQFAAFAFDDQILEAAKKLFWALASMSLVWTMGLLILRQDIGEVLMELVRFMVVTGTLYWLLINASDHQDGEAFISKIVSSFFQMINGDDEGVAFRSNANEIFRLGLDIYLKVITETEHANDSDKLLSGGMAILILVALAVMAAQFLLAVVVAWMMGYAGIFLLGFGGGRWTSQIAINYYKHVVALGVAILALGIIGAVGSKLLNELTWNPARAVTTEFGYLGLMIAVSTLMLVLSVRVPQLLYTLVTGSTLGFFAGAAGMIGSAIGAGGGAALASAMGRAPGPGAVGSDGESTARTASVMDAVHRSAAAAGGMGDPFHVGGGSDPFGAPRSADPYRHGHRASVFGASMASPASSGTSSNEPASQSSSRAAFIEVGKSGNTRRDESTASSKTPPVSDGAEGVARGEAKAPAQASAPVQTDEAHISEPASRPDYEAEMSAIAVARAGTQQGGGPIATPPSIDNSGDSLTAAASMEVVEVPVSEHDASQHSEARAPTDARPGDARAVSHSMAATSHADEGQVLTGHHDEAAHVGHRVAGSTVASMHADRADVVSGSVDSLRSTALVDDAGQGTPEIKTGVRPQDRHAASQVTTDLSRVDEGQLLARHQDDVTNLDHRVAQMSADAMEVDQVRPHTPSRDRSEHPDGRTSPSSDSSLAAADQGQTNDASGPLGDPPSNVLGVDAGNVPPEIENGARPPDTHAMPQANADSFPADNGQSISWCYDDVTRVERHLTRMPAASVEADRVEGAIHVLSSSDSELPAETHAADARLLRAKIVDPGQPATDDTPAVPPPTDDAPSP